VLLDRILRDGESAESAYLLGQSEYLRQNMVAAAGRLGAGPVELNPNLPGVHSLYGKVLREIGKPDAAAEQFNAELKANPNDFARQYRNGDGGSGRRASSMRRWPTLKPHYGYVRPTRGALYQRASIHSVQGRTEKAPRGIGGADSADHPDFAEAHAALGHRLLPAQAKG